MDVGINSLVIRMINTNISFRIFSGVMLASVALMAVGCMKPSVRDLADDLHSSGGSSLTIWHDSFEAAREQALVSGKPILADFTGSDWCSWCVKLKKDVFNKPEFEAWARENVVLLELDYPQRSRQSSEIRGPERKTGQPVFDRQLPDSAAAGRSRKSAGSNRLPPRPRSVYWHD